jgi:hypothetical protein
LLALGATPYRGKKPLFCQAAGCGKRIEGWCYVETVLGRAGQAIIPISKEDPAVEKAKRKAEEAKRKREEKERAKQREVRLGSLSGNQCLDCSIFMVLCCCPCILWGIRSP